jgi:polyhydroxybutyrate depolymerase
MAAAVACLRPDAVTALGPVTATVPPDVVCARAGPIPYVYFHGTADAAVPFEGGPGTPGPVESTSQAWADHNGCDPTPVEEPVGDEVVRRSWTGCDAPTTLYIVEGGGHTWPGAIDVPGLGVVTRDIDATAIIWQTFVDAWPSGERAGRATPRTAATRRQAVTSNDSARRSRTSVVRSAGDRRLT